MIVTNDPYSHYMNYDEIQRVIKRKPDFTPVHRQRPVSNFFEYGGAPKAPPNTTIAHPHLHAPSAGNVRVANGIYGTTTRLRILLAFICVV